MSITKNEDGTYEVTLGIAEGLTNYRVWFDRYVVEEELKRLNKKPLGSEMGYPIVDKRIASWERHARLLTIRLDQVCGYFTDLVISTDQSPMITAIFRPAGSRLAETVKLLDQKPSSVRFCHRAETMGQKINGHFVAVVKHIVTWDLISGEA